jgi:Fe-S-cluster containining protein
MSQEKDAFLKFTENMMQILSEEDFRLLVATNIRILEKKTDEIEPMIEKCLSFYNCKKCGECCHKYPVSLEDDELLVLLKKYGNRVFELLDEGVLNNVLKPPCGYFKNKECSIHEIKPNVCKLYPFSLSRGNIIVLFFCPLGEEIYEDLSTCLDNYRKQKGIKISAEQQAEIRKEIETRDNASERIYNTCGYKMTGTKELLGTAIFYEAIPVFLKYLQQKSKHNQG